MYILPLYVYDAFQETQAQESQNSLLFITTIRTKCEEEKRSLIRVLGINLARLLKY